MPPTKSKTRQCASCTEPAKFITPAGLYCPDDAILAAVRQVDSHDQWMPVPIKANTRDPSYRRDIPDRRDG